MLKGLESTKYNALPPVHEWTPAFCGDMDFVIKSNGDWVHEGQKISRTAMVKMFSRILWLEDEQYYLVTPVEKVRIQVEDAPFMIISWQWIDTAQGRAVEFRTLTDDNIILGIDCDIWLAPYQGNERPYVSMRYGMKALISRHVYYDMANELETLTTSEGTGVGIWSAGKTYLLMNEE
ncbi:DUF1285 domain-containing protein [Psychromonas sp. GE-S-Ul-11]|uniref:DUF1285 domain-containing protein n=1 Tax=Psychromonas sp. GE-S-Ul-11 TaxID=3241170 RepID=UPI00390C642D